MTVIGARVDRVDGRLKVTGKALYTADVALPAATHAVMVLSAIPSGRITAIDSLDAQCMPGVLKVMSHLNAPRLPDGGKAGVNPPAGRVLSLFQDNIVAYARQPVALVVAESLEQATAAAGHVRVSYEAKPAQLDFAAARTRAHAPDKVIGQDSDSMRGQVGDEHAAASVTATYRTPMEHHNPIEPHATLAYWEGNQLTVYDTTQYIDGCQTTIAKTLGIPKDTVRVICRYVGGGFGSKGSAWSHVLLAAMVAGEVRRPVKLVVERPQMFGPIGGRPQTEQSMRVSADRTGRFLELQHESWSHTSMIEDFTEPAALQTRILYDCASNKTTHRLVPLNVPTPTFQRAPGHATGTFALESAIDELAFALGMDPIRLRLRNEPAKDPQTQLPWSSRALPACFEEGAAAFGWQSRNPEPRSMREGGELVGLGVATATYPANRSAANAVARLLPDGTLLVQCGTQDLGTGTYTIMTQVAADAMGMPIERVRCELGDSRFPQAPVSGGSQSAASVTPAVASAVRALRDKLIAMGVADRASTAYQAAPGSVVIDAGGMGLSGTSRRETLAALIERNGAREIVAEATTKPGEEKRNHSMHSFGAVFVEVRIDPDLRIIRVPRVVARYSIGRLLNAKLGHSQLMGGVVWGVGMALLEESVLDQRTGRIVNANLAEYHVPTNADIGLVDVGVVADNDPHINPFGARGIGEIGITGVAAAIANAVYHATGIRVRELPITLDKLMA